MSCSGGYGEEQSVKSLHMFGSDFPCRQTWKVRSNSIWWLSKLLIPPKYRSKRICSEDYEKHFERRFVWIVMKPMRGLPWTIDTFSRSDLNALQNLVAVLSALIKTSLVKKNKTMGNGWNKHTLSNTTANTTQHDIRENTAAKRPKLCNKQHKTFPLYLDLQFHYFWRPVQRGKINENSFINT